jgi:hypothetical protein
MTDDRAKWKVHGPVASLKSEFAEWDLELPRMRSPHIRFECRYDTHGNWVEKTVSMRFEANAEFQPSNVTHRAITYHRL